MGGSPNTDFIRLAAEDHLLSEPCIYMGAAVQLLHPVGITFLSSASVRYFLPSTQYAFPAVNNFPSLPSTSSRGRDTCTFNFILHPLLFSDRKCVFSTEKRHHCLMFVLNGNLLSSSLGLPPPMRRVSLVRPSARRRRRCQS